MAVLEIISHKNISLQLSRKFSGTTDSLFKLEILAGLLKDIWERMVLGEHEGPMCLACMPLFQKAMGLLLLMSAPGLGQVPDGRRGAALQPYTSCRLMFIEGKQGWCKKPKRVTDWEGGY